MLLDKTDLEIVRLLKNNAKLTNKEIGEITHMTGQAVGVRLSKLIDEGVVKRFTVETDARKMGIDVMAIVTVYMKTLDHDRMKRLISETEEVVEAHRISGEGCYSLKIEAVDMLRLNEILDQINQFANYKLSLSIGCLKG